jgi:hypothetical protein
MFFWGEEKQRREFSIVIKRIEWLGAAETATTKRMLDKYVKNGKVPSKMPRSQCRVCKRPLTWGSRTYDFDHKDNNSANNSQTNCYLVCKNCHGGATKTKVVREYNPYTGEVVSYKTIKLKVGYKKNPRKLESKTSEKAATKTPKKSATKPSKKIKNKTAKKSAQKTTRKPTTKIAKKSASKTSKKSAIKTAKKTESKTAKKPAKKTASKRTTKPAKKPARKSAYKVAAGKSK